MWNWKLKKVDGSEFDTVKKESAVPIDMILHSMWSSVDIKMNHTLVRLALVELITCTKHFLKIFWTVMKMQRKFNWVL